MLKQIEKSMDDRTLIYFSIFFKYYRINKFIVHTSLVA